MQEPVVELDVGLVHDMPKACSFQLSELWNENFSSLDGSAWYSAEYGGTINHPCQDPVADLWIE